MITIWNLHIQYKNHQNEYNSSLFQIYLRKNTWSFISCVMKIEKKNDNKCEILKLLEIDVINYIHWYKYKQMKRRNEKEKWKREMKRKKSKWKRHFIILTM
jgi:hypothetical protein